MARAYNIFKAAGFKNLRQVAGKLGKAPIVKEASAQSVRAVKAGGDVAVSKIQQQGGGGATPAYKKGGIVKKTGLAKVHKGELIIPRHMVRSLHIRT